MEIVNQSGYHIAWVQGSFNHPTDSLTFCVKASFQLVPDDVAIAADAEMLNGDVYIKDDIKGALNYDSDFAYFKEKADILLKGTCYVPDVIPVSQSYVRLNVGDVDKTLVVYGPRFLEPGLTGSSPSSVQPFVSMPLSYEYAYGGLGYSHNPSGKGREKDDNGITWLPNVVDPNLGEETPAGFGPINRCWPQRAEKMGTYGDDYLEKRWPWFPEDFDWAYFNSAPEDMQSDGYLVGDESLVLENLHPKYSRYKSQLPSVKPRCFIREHEGGEEFREVAMQLDTLYIDMDKELVSLVWRGVEDIKSRDFRELSHVYLASESLDEPASLDDHKVAFEALAFPVLVVEEEAEAEAVEPVPVEPAAEQAPAEAQPDDMPPALEKVVTQARQVMADSGQNPDLIDDIVNSSDPYKVVAGIMTSLGLELGSSESFLSEVKEKNIQSLKEQGVSDSDIENLFGGDK